MNFIKTTQTVYRNVAILVISVLLISCGGGGGGSTGTAVTYKINDTGQTLCYNNTVEVTCATLAAESPTVPRQDALFGRDANTALTKVGAGAAGFDYTRVCMSGKLAGVGACAANPTAAADQAAPTANEWACTKDNVTKLIWSLEIGTGDWTRYATTTHPAAVNATARCGFNTGWRLPTRRELLSLVHSGVFSPAIDTAYFPGTAHNLDWTYDIYWSNDIYMSSPDHAWVVSFLGGSTTFSNKAAIFQARLVRSVQ